MSRILSIDSSFQACSVAYCADGETIQREFTEPRRHGEVLLPAVHEVLADAGASLSGLDAIAFSRGPGSFTSLRLGIGVAQGLAWGGDVGVVPVSSLVATAQVARRIFADSGQDEVSDQWPVAVAMDARMDEVFWTWCVLDENGLARGLDVAGEQVGPPTEWRQSAEAVLSSLPGQGWIAAGNGFERFPALAEISPMACLPEAVPDARAIGLLAAGWLAHSEPLEPSLAQPVYIRDRVADKPA